jgi:hypothetical protein
VFVPVPTVAEAPSPVANECNLTVEEERALRERAVAWVERACAEQGVAVKLSDPLVLDKIAEILLSAREKRSPSER